MKQAADIIERIMQTAKAALPESVGNDVKASLRSAIQDVIADLDVVTREELDIQKEVLKKTRNRVDELESVIENLERQLKL